MSLERARAARERIGEIAVRTPLVRLEDDAFDGEIWLKLENLQPIRSFKIRGAANAMLAAGREALREGVWAASAGNMAQGVAWCARHLDVPCTVVMPQGAPRAKRDAVARLGGRIVEVPFEEWFRIYETRTHPAGRGTFVHAFSDAEVMAGNGTIALEILDDLPDVDAVVAPYGGGGLCGGIGSVLREAGPQVRVLAAEVETAAPLTAAFAAGEPVPIEHERSFVDGIGGPMLFPEMWELATRVLDGITVSSLEQICAAIRLLLHRGAVVAEGAGAAAVAGALSGQAGTGKVVCVVSGGNLDAEALRQILDGCVPTCP